MAIKKMSRHCTFKSENRCQWMNKTFNFEAKGRPLTLPSPSEPRKAISSTPKNAIKHHHLTILLTESITHREISMTKHKNCARSRRAGCGWVAKEKMKKSSASDCMYSRRLLPFPSSIVWSKLSGLHFSLPATYLRLPLRGAWKQILFITSSNKRGSESEPFWLRLRHPLEGSRLLSRSHSLSHSNETIGSNKA